MSFSLDHQHNITLSVLRYVEEIDLIRFMYNLKIQTINLYLMQYDITIELVHNTM